MDVRVHYALRNSAKCSGKLQQKLTKCAAIYFNCVICNFASKNNAELIKLL